MLLIIPNVALDITEQYPLLMKVANVLLPLGLWGVVMGVVRRTGVAMLCLLPIYVFCAFQIVLLYLYGESIIAIDMFMNVMTTNPGEATELLANMKLALLTVFLLYLPPIIMGIRLTAKKVESTPALRRRMRRLGLGSMLVGIIALVVSVLVNKEDSRPARQLFPYNVISNLVTAIERNAEARHYHETSAAFTFDAHSTRTDSLREVYVMVIGETARAMNWSLFGYDRDTNPRLSQRQGVIGYGRALSEINTTHKSVPMLMSSLDAETFGRNVAHSRSIFEAFNGAGFSTWFVSNQHRNHSYIDFYGEEAQNVKFLTDESGVHDDLDLARELRTILRTDHANKIFVILHMYGSHFEYQKRYPANEAFFLPDANAEASRLNRDQLINAYDNTIRHTDRILDSIIGVLAADSIQAALLYTSDHGEDIFDDNRERFLHASPVATYYQLHVPLVMWMSDAMQTANPGLYRTAVTNSAKEVSSSRTMFHTMMQLAGLQASAADSTQSLVSNHYHAIPHRYLNDYNESLPLSRSGMRAVDIKQLKAAGFTID